MLNTGSGGGAGSANESDWDAFVREELACIALQRSRVDTGGSNGFALSPIARRRSGNAGTGHPAPRIAPRVRPAPPR